MIERHYDIAGASISVDWPDDLRHPLWVDRLEPFQSTCRGLPQIVFHLKPSLADFSFLRDGERMIVTGPCQVAAALLLCALRNALYRTAGRGKGVILHAAGLRAPQGTAIILAGVSNVGKTTACKLAPSGYQLLSDEHVILREVDGMPMVFSTPFFSGDADLGLVLSRSCLAGAFFFLVRGSPAATRLTPHQAFRRMVLAGTGFSAGMPLTQTHLDLSAAFAKTPAFQLATANPDQVWPRILDVVGKPR